MLTVTVSEHVEYSIYASKLLSDHAAQPGRHRRKINTRRVPLVERRAYQPVLAFNIVPDAHKERIGRRTLQ